MMRLELGAIARLTEGRLHGPNSLVQGMIHDTRLLAPGNLFAALPGARVDGHDYVAAAARAGAAGALVARLQQIDLGQVMVADVLRAMGRVAAHWRSRMSARVIGVTGSNGKTTVKEMLAAILSRRGPTLATRGNYNNEIGLPLTLARLAPTHRYAVLEMGASRPGDISSLAEITRPEIGVLTNAAPAHLEWFGSLDGVARTKGELLEALPESGTAILNRDDPYYPMWRDMAAHCLRISFGLHADADVRADEAGNGPVSVTTPAGGFELELRLPGRHNLMNALAASAAAQALDIPLSTVRGALSDLASLPGRLVCHRLPAGWRVIDDSYNANPASVRAGLEVLKGLKGDAWLVLGDMAELGDASAGMHRELGRTARDLGVARLFALGGAAAESAAAFGAGARHFTSRRELIETLKAEIGPGVNCLVKGSRSMGMEHVVRALIGEDA